MSNEDFAFDFRKPGWDGREDDGAPTDPKMRIKKKLCSVCGQSFPESDIADVEGHEMCHECAERQGKFVAGHSDIHDSLVNRNQYVDSHSDRKTSRIAIEGCFARLSKKGTLVRILSTGRSVMAPVLDLSITGLQCITHLAVELGEEIKIELRLPGLKDSLVLDGIIRRSVISGKEGEWKVGVEFTNLEFNTRRMIDNFARQVSTDRARQNK
ncbi:MAG: PilZ domain-containing protein [Planctomycetes bacterium]|nr:PilZ domain-containing protein [Planctomycetota bacterium]